MYVCITFKFLSDGTLSQYEKDRCGISPSEVVLCFHPGKLHNFYMVMLYDYQVRSQKNIELGGT